MQDIDVVIVGAGVAGLTAAMVAGRHGVKVAVVDRMGVGGQISTAERIENFPGFPQGIAGHELGPLLHEQAEAAGAEFMLDTIESIKLSTRLLTALGGTFCRRITFWMLAMASRTVTFSSPILATVSFRSSLAELEPKPGINVTTIENAIMTSTPPRA